MKQIKTLTDLLKHFELPKTQAPAVVHGYQIEQDAAEWVVVTPSEDEWFFDSERAAVRYVVKELLKRQRIPQTPGQPIVAPWQDLLLEA